MDVRVRAVKLHLIWTDGFWSIRGHAFVSFRRTFPCPLFVFWKHLLGPSEIDWSSCSVLLGECFMSYSNRVLLIWEQRPYILKTTCDTRMYVVKFKKPFIVSGFAFPETDPDFLQMQLLGVLLRSSFFHTLSVSRSCFHLADHVADRWGEECSMWHQVGRLFA